MRLKGIRGWEQRPFAIDCTGLTEAVIPSGHWMAQEQPIQVNAALAKWLAAKAPDAWPYHIVGW
jgi:pimeloyl-ACP methyl ester carboxylesterase